MAKVMYRSRLFRVEKYGFSRGAKTMMFDRILGPNTVTVVPVFGDGRILLERQYRHAIKKYLYELPAGHIDPGETPAQAASRELEEEVGYRPGKLSKLYAAYVSPGTKTELQTCFVATDLRRTKASPEEDEIITTKAVTLDQALRMARSNAVRDMKTIAALLFYARFRSRSGT
jgi:ADP-ribose pyrophosphatase